VPQEAKGEAMTQKRWMKSVIRAAAECKTAMPWERGATRKAMIARRHMESAKAKLAGA
jgi:hypothetical protein